MSSENTVLDQSKQNYTELIKFMRPSDTTSLKVIILERGSSSVFLFTYTCITYIGNDSVSFDDRQLRRKPADYHHQEQEIHTAFDEMTQMKTRNCTDFSD